MSRFQAVWRRTPVGRNKSHSE